jgi:hypothetical protein
MCRRKKGIIMGLYEDWGEDQDSEVRNIEEAFGNYVWLKTRQFGKYLSRTQHGDIHDKHT